MNRLIAFFVTKRLFVDLLVVFLVLAGIYSLMKIRRDFFPNVSFDIVNIQTIYPGSSAEDVEKLVTNKIEQDLKEVDGIKKMKSMSVESLSEITITLDPDTTNEMKGKQDIKDVIDRLEIELPEQSETPIVTTIDSKQTPVMQVGLSADLDEVALRDLAKKIENEIESVPGVAKVVSSDMRDKEIHVEANPDLLLRYDVTLVAIAQALKGHNVSIPAGSLKVGANDFGNPEMGVRTIGEFRTAEDVENTVVRANELGRAIRVKDLAKVTYGLREADVITRVDGRTALNLVVLKKENADAITVSDLVFAKLDEIKKTFEADKPILAVIQDTSIYIKNRLSVLSGNLVIGLILVMIILAIFLPLRIALVTAMGIPLSFLGAIIIFQMMGLSLNVISLIGLIIVVGMLVDDAVVVTDAIVMRMEAGQDPKVAAIEGTGAVWPAVTASVFTTVVAFAPMLFMSGIFGKFVREIPIGVIVPLLFSLVEAFFILPTHIAHFVSMKSIRLRNEKISKTPSIWEKKIVPGYENILSKLLGKRYWGLGGLVVLFGLSMFIAATQMKFVLFPPEGVEAFIVRGRTSVGFSLAQTEAAAKPIEAKILDYTKGYLNHVLTNVGVQQNDPNDPARKRGSEYFQFVVFLIPEKDRDKSANQILEMLRSKIEKPDVVSELVFETINPGPPVGKAIDVAVRGEDYDRINEAVAELKQMFATIDGVTDISDSYVQGKQEYRFIVNPSEASSVGLSVAEVGNAVRTAIEGTVATSIQQLGDQVDIRVSFPESFKKDIKSLEDLRIPNRMGQHVRLMSIAKIETHRTIASYEHQEGRRQVRVSANVDIDKISSVQANQKIKTDFMPQIEKKYPGLKLAFGGEDEDTQESMRSLGEAFVFAIFGIFLILVWTFGSLVQPLVVLVAIPLGVIAATWALFIHAMPLSFMSMLGMIALGGVIVNNAIIFIDFVNSNRAKGLDRFESIVKAGRYRLRPIMLTTLTTVLGLMPTAYGIGGEDKFVVPIAIVLGWGIAIGSFLTAFAVPVMLSISDDVLALFGRMFKNKDVEY
jgi:multidrug efflux pump subunit AcrB